MAEKSISLVLSANTVTSATQSVLTITGRTVYGRTVSASTEVVQAAYHPQTGQTYTLGSVTYAVTKPQGKSDIDSIYAGPLTITYVSPDESQTWGFVANPKTISGITTSATTCATTWNYDTFTAPSGSTLTGRLNIRSTHAAITSARVEGFNNHGAGYTGTLDTVSTKEDEGWYVFDFDFGTLPSGSNLGNSVTIRLITDSYYNVEITRATPSIKVVNSTNNQVYVSVSMYATHYGLASDSVLCLSTSSQKVNGGGTTTISATRQIPDSATMIPNIQKVWCTWNISGAPTGTHAEITITGLSNKIETQTTQMERLTSHMVLSTADDFILRITT